MEAQLHQNLNKLIIFLYVELPVKYIHCDGFTCIQPGSHLC